MTTRSRSTIIGGGVLIQSSSGSDATEYRFEFGGAGTNPIEIKDRNGNPVFCDPESVKLFVFGQLKTTSEYTLEQGEHGTILTPNNPLPKPRSGVGPNCVVFYRNL